MTGFGQGVGEDARHRVTVTLRAFNHRYLDIQIRFPEEYQSSEAELRELLTGELLRGRVEAHVTVQRLGERSAEVEVHRSVLQAVHSALHELAEEGLIGSELVAGDLLRLPEVFRVELAADEWSEGDHRLLLEVASQALQQLVGARSVEGEKMAQALSEKLEDLAALVARLDTLSEETRGAIRSSLEQRLVELLGDRQLPEERLAQEVALLVDRADVSEEIDRLRAHVEHFRSVLEQPGAIGKRLDFLIQEMFRELNTAGAKCRSSEMTRSVLDSKVLCEQLREQVQNLE
jgi:uncharacterized protein (TIGR00255 family)